MRSNFRVRLHSITREKIGLRAASSAAAIAISTIVVAPAYAQEAQEGETQSASASETAGDIVVTGSRFQVRKDIATRRNSTVVVDSLSQDDIGALPDRTIADSLRRITGVTTLNDDDIGRFVSVRGVNPDLVAVTVNGLTLASIASSGGGRRQTNLQVIPSRAVQQIQAYKSFTPDMDSGAMGGLVNLVPASAYDYDGRHLVVEASANYSSFLDVPNVNTADGIKSSPFGSGAELTYADTFGSDSQFGLVVSGVWQQRPKDQSNVTIPDRLYFNDEGEKTNPGNPDWNGIGVPNTFTTVNYTNIYRTYGGSVMLEYNPMSSFRTSLFGFLYFNSESETRNHHRLFGFDEVRETTPTTGTLRAGTLDHEWRHNTFDRDTKGLQWQALYGSETAGDFNFRAGYSFASFDNVQPSATYRMKPGLDLTYDLEADDRYVLENPEAYVTPSNYQLFAAHEALMLVQQEALEARLDYSLNAGANDLGFGFMAGAAYRHTDLERDRDFVDYSSDGSDMIGVSVLPDRAVRGSPYPLLWLDHVAFWNDVAPTLEADPAKSFRRSMITDYSYVEKIANAYAALTFATDDLRLVGGVRYDHTRFVAGMPQILDGVVQDRLVESTGGYEKFLPSVNGLYRLTNDFRVKFGYSRTLGRPNPSDIASVEEVDDVELIISRGNPNLRPRVSDNFDLGIEYFFNQGNGMITAGLFAKDVADDIIMIEREELRNGQVYQLREPINGDKTTFRGFEIGIVNSELDFLPGALANLGFSGNLLYVRGRTKFTDDGVTTTRKSLVNQMEWAGNAALFYNYEDRGEIRVAYNYQSGYVTGIGANPWNDQGIGANDTIDLTVRYDLDDHWGVQFQARNLLGKNRAVRSGDDLRYHRADVEYGNMFFLSVNYLL